jgi:trimeric autotransporter adhesin
MKSLFICFILVAATNCVAQNVGIGTTTPVAALHVVDSNVVFTGPAAIPAFTTYNPPIQGAGTRMMWYPEKAAFRVGTIDGNQWDKINIGNFSFASGNNTRASGNSSTAMGERSIAAGISSTAIGYNSLAIGNYSTAFGFNSLALGNYSTAFGNDVIASVDYSTAMGYGAHADGIYSFANGFRVTANAYVSTALGTYNDEIIASPSTSWIPTEPLLIIGNGNYPVKSNALVILKNGNTGIGTSAPTQKLEVAGKIKTTDLQITAGAANGKILSSDASGNASWVTPAATTNYWTGSGNNVYSNNTGYVGIGTITPKVKLHVVKGVPLVDPNLGSTMAIQSDGETTLQILSGDNIDYGGSIVFGHNLQNISAGIQFNTFAGNELSFYTNASLPTFTMNNLGNIGIHTVAPKAAFNVGAGKTVLFGGDSSGAGSKLIWYSSKSAFRTGYAFGNNWDLNNVGTNSFATGIATLASGYTSTAFGAFNTASGNYSTAMGTEITAKSYNEMSIGSYNTDYTPLSASAWNSADRLFIIGNGTNSGSRSDAMVVLKNGNTGIGTSTPSEKLVVAGKIKTTDLQITSGAAFGKILTSDASGNGTWVTPATIPANYWTVSGNNIYNNNAGNIGIGTTTPSNARLVISGNAGQEGLDLSSTDQYANLRVIRNSLGSDKDMYIGLGSGAVSSMHLFSNNVETITLKAGNAGIGTSSPNAPLQFATSNQKRKIVLFETANNDNQFFGFGVFAGELRYQTGVATDDHVFYTAASSSSSNELMRIKGNGNVGIGTNNPNTKLDVAGVVNATSGYTQVSDIRYKRNVTKLHNPLNNLLQLNGAQYYFNQEDFPAMNFSSSKQIGLIAQEVEKVFPELVSANNEGYKSVNYTGLIPVMIESIKEQQKQIEKQNEQIEKLTRLVNQLLNK